MKILYSFNKLGAEAEFWQREIAEASSPRVTFVPFNHGLYLEPNLYRRAQLLDELYYDRNSELTRLYADVERRFRDEAFDVLLVDNCSPYHPDWLRRLPAFKVLRTSDGPLTAYDRDFAYAHAYGLILYHSPAYSRDMEMGEKLRYVGAKQSAYWPLGLFDAAFTPGLPEEELFSRERDLDVVFVGALYLGKMPLLAKVKKAFGSRCRMHGLASLKKNTYFNVMYGWPGWVRPIPQSAYIPLYQRAKIGINIHNRGKYTVGSYRLYELPANGVMQISDGDEYLGTFFDVGNEIVGYSNADDLIEKIHFYIANDAERIRIARNAYQRVCSDYRIKTLLHKAAEIIAQAIK